MTCREIGPCWQGDMDFRRVKGRKNMIDYRLEIKVERQYRIWGELFYLFNIFFDVLSPLFQFTMQRVQKQFQWQSWLYVITTVPPPEMENTGTASQNTFLGLYQTEDVQRWRLSLFYSGRRNYYGLDFFKAFIFREKDLSDTTTISVMRYSMFPKPVSKSMRDFMLTSFATYIYLFFYYGSY